MAWFDIHCAKHCVILKRCRFWIVFGLRSASVASANEDSYTKRHWDVCDRPVWSSTPGFNLVFTRPSPGCATIALGKSITMCISSPAQVRQQNCFWSIRKALDARSTPHSDESLCKFSLCVFLAPERKEVGRTHVVTVFKSYFSWNNITIIERQPLPARSTVKEAVTSPYPPTRRWFQFWTPWSRTSAKTCGSATKASRGARCTSSNYFCAAREKDLRNNLSIVLLNADTNYKTKCSW